MIAGSCQFGGNRSSGNQEGSEPLSEAAEQTTAVAEKSTTSQPKTPEQELEEAKAALDEFFGKLAETVDEARIETSPHYLNDGIPAPRISGKMGEKLLIGGQTIAYIYKNS